jgi:hypothetical protein
MIPQIDELEENMSEGTHPDSKQSSKYSLQHRTHRFQWVQSLWASATPDYSSSAIQSVKCLRHCCRTKLSSAKLLT